MPVGKGNVLKVNISWGLLIIAGIGSFALAKSQVISQRQENMRKQRALKKQVEDEILRED